jgi:hypothetical protein
MQVLMLYELERAYTCTETPESALGRNFTGIKEEYVMGMGPDPSWMFDFAGTVVPIFLVVMIGIVAVSVGKGLVQWSRNNNSPMLTAPAQIVSKRTEIRQQQLQDEGGSSRTSTTYYLTYELGDGARMEFKVDGNEYGMSAEGDRGLLSYQGTRYHGFRRQPYFTTADHP